MFSWFDTAIDPFAVLALALLLDALLGEPSWLYNRIGHPVVAIGRLIGGLDVRFNDERHAAGARRRAGILVMALLVLVHAALGGLLTWLYALTPLDLVLEAVVCALLLAGRSLYDHVARVALGLETQGLEGGRREIAHLVGRDPRTLDEAGVARGAIESLAENFSDGVIAPWFWYALFGLPGLLVYKAVNTADSMIGHRNARYRDFGWAAARLDDVMNLAPARLSGALLAATAWLASWERGAAGWRAMRRDAPRHQSPNAGWPEAAMAGALGLALNGPRSYAGVVSDDAWMGDGREAARPRDIRRALKLYFHAWGLLGLMSLLALWLYR